MKKVVVILLLFLYMIPAIGISISGHYCGGRLVSVSMGTGDDVCVCGNKKRTDCCKTKTAFIKLCEVHKSNQQFHVTAPKESLKQILYPLPTGFIFQVEAQRAYNFASAHPPNYTDQSLYLVNRVFRI